MEMPTQPSTPQGHVNRVQTCLAGVKTGVFTCVKWQVGCVSQQFALTRLYSSLRLLSSEVPGRLTGFYIIAWNRQPAQGAWIT